VDSSWSPTTSGSYAVQAQWSWSSAIQYVEQIEGCGTSASAYVVITLVIGIWDQAGSGYSVYQGNTTTILIAGANDQGWCNADGQDVSAMLTPSSVVTTTPYFTLNSGDGYQFRSSIQFITFASCSSLVNCYQAESQINCDTGSGCGEYDLTLNWVQVYQ
jgi:hypothetical protein